MNVTTTVAALARESALADQIAARKPTLAALGGALLSAEFGALTVTATDMELAIRSKVPATVHATGSVVVSARTLSDLAKTLAPGDVTLVRDGGFVRLTSGSFKARLQALPGEDFPSLPQMPEGAVADLPRAALRSMIRRTRFASTDADQRFFLAGSLVEAGDGVFRMVATDAKRLAVVEIASALVVQPELLPKKTLEVLAGLADDSDVETVGFAVGENHLFLELGDRLLVSKKIDGKFPQWRRLLQPQAPRATVDRAALAVAFRRAGLVADQETRFVKMSVEDAGMRLETASAAIGSSDEDLACDSVEVGVAMRQVGMNSGFVMSFVEACEAAKVTVEQGKPTAPVIWREVMDGGLSYLYLTLPLAL